MVEEDSSDVLETLLLDLPDEPELPFEVQIEKKTIQRKEFTNYWSYYYNSNRCFYFNSITIQNLTVPEEPEIDYSEIW